MSLAETSTGTETLVLALTVSLGVLGLLIGSFLNVVIHRVPRDESVVEPPSHCPTCDQQLRWYDNVPVVSWIMLRGRCRYCGAPISVRYLLVEVFTGLCFAMIGWTVLDGSGASVALALTLCYAAAVGIALALIDLAVHRLPDALTVPAPYILAVGLAFTAALGGGAENLVRAVLGGAVCYLFFFALALIYPSGMGGGDVKLAPSLGLLLGWAAWPAVVIGIFGSFVLAGIFVVLLALRGRAGRKTQVPFGPWLILGCVVGLTAWEPITRWYVDIAL